MTSPSAVSGACRSGRSRTRPLCGKDELPAPPARAHRPPGATPQPACCPPRGAGLPSEDGFVHGPEDRPSASLPSPSRGPGFSTLTCGWSVFGTKILNSFLPQTLLRPCVRRARSCLPQPCRGAGPCTASRAFLIKTDPRTCARHGHQSTLASGDGTAELPPGPTLTAAGSPSAAA